MNKQQLRIFNLQNSVKVVEVRSSNFKVVSLLYIVIYIVEISRKVTAANLQNDEQLTFQIVHFLSTIQLLDF